MLAMTGSNVRGLWKTTSVDHSHLLFRQRRDYDRRNHAQLRFGTEMRDQVEPLQPWAATDELAGRCRFNNAA